MNEEERKPSLEQLIAEAEAKKKPPKPSSNTNDDAPEIGDERDEHDGKTSEENPIAKSNVLTR